MHTSTLLTTVAGLATIAAANPFPNALPRPTIGPVLAHAARDKGGNSNFNPTLQSSCDSIFTSLSRDEPPAPSELSSFLSASATAGGNLGDLITSGSSSAADAAATALCEQSKTLTPPASLSSAYASWQAQRTSWAKAHADKVHSYASSCGGLLSAEINVLAITDGPSCTTSVEALVHAAQDLLSSASALDSSARANGTVPAPTPAAGGNGSAPTTSSSTAGGAGMPRETGYVAAVAAAAVGLAGVMAAL